MDELRGSPRDGRTQFRTANVAQVLSLFWCPPKQYVRRQREPFPYVSPHRDEPAGRQPDTGGCAKKTIASILVIGLRKESIMHKKLIAPFATVALTGAMLAGAAMPAAVAAPPASASAQELASTTSATINQTIEGVGTFAGTFAPTQFVVEDGQLVVEGLLNGTFTDAETGAVTTFVNEAISTTVTGASANESCDILNLELGPLDLNLLGLDVQLSQVNLDVTAVPGAGNLLGNLLCAVAGLLDGNATTGLANLLNRLLSL